MNSTPTTSSNTEQRQYIQCKIYSSGTTMAAIHQNESKDEYSRLKDGTVESKPESNNLTIAPHACRQLPNELISLILSYLPTLQLSKTLYECSLVTKQFYANTIPILWQELYFYDVRLSRYALKLLGFSYTINSERFFDCLSDAAASSSTQRLSALGQHIHTLGLNSIHWTDDHLQLLLPHIPNLKHINLCRTKLTDTSFQHLPYYCQQLTTLRFYYQCNLSRAVFSAIGQHCHQLVELDWNLSKDQSLEWLELLGNCPLENLRIRFLESLPSSWNENSLLILKSWRHRLTRLNISIGMRPVHLASLVLLPPPLYQSTTTAQSSWPQLTNLFLDPCHDTDDTILMTFIQLHLQLEELELMHTSSLTDASIDAMANWLPKLRRVCLWGIDIGFSYGAIQRLVKQCRHLVLVKINPVEYVGQGQVEVVNSGHWYTGTLDIFEIEKIRQGESE